jgi:hypothetical protein
LTEKRKGWCEIRPSQLLFTYGIGSIVDLPELSVLVMGLEEWPNQRSVLKSSKTGCWRRFVTNLIRS